MVRIRRLTQLGLSLPEVSQALRGDDEHDVRQIRRELVADLARQEASVREQRRRQRHHRRRRRSSIQSAQTRLIA